MDEKQWQNYGQRNGRMLQLADIVAKNQTNDKAQFTKTGKRIFDKHLYDVMLYRKDGNFISPYHANLYIQRKNGNMSCPVYEIMYKAYVQGEKNRAYIKKVNSSEESKPKTVKVDLMYFDDAYKEFKQDYLEPFFKNRQVLGSKKPQDFIFDSLNTQVIYDLVAYFTRQFNSNLDLSKGICLYGDIGSGKSTIMKALSKFTRDKDLITQFDFIYMDDVYSDCQCNGLDSLNSYKFRSCAFDDIGMRAEKDVSNYGTKINSYRELVRRQYNRYTRPTPSLSHYTTNIEYSNKNHDSELVKIFGGRELDRFREMCNFVYLGGPSRRK